MRVCVCMYVRAASVSVLFFNPCGLRVLDRKERPFINVKLCQQDELDVLIHDDEIQVGCSSTARGIQMKTLAVWLCLCIIAGESMGASIDAFGAVAGVNTEAAAVKNSAAIVSALQAADKAGKGGDHVVVVPQGSTYYIFNSSVAGLTDVTLEIEGTLILNNNRDVWKARTNATHVGALAFDGCANLTITGSGLIDGQGYVSHTYTSTQHSPTLTHSTQHIHTPQIYTPTSPHTDTHIHTHTYHMFLLFIVDIHRSCPVNWLARARCARLGSLRSLGLAALARSGSQLTPP